MNSRYRIKGTENDNMISLGENIRKARKKMGITQEELATQLGVTSQAVSRWESGAGMPDVSMIVPIARVLSVSADMLFGIDHVDNDEMIYAEIIESFVTIENEAEFPRVAALKECEYMIEKVDSDPANYIYATCLVERTANLSRYVDFENFATEVWQEIKKKAIRSGMQVIRFCNKTEWLERTHFALAWIYIHEKDYTSAREHISLLPSISNNRLQESILAQIAGIEFGVEEMKGVLNSNLQNYTRVINKEILYATETLSWSADAKEAVEFGLWGIEIMKVLCQKKEMLSSCRGFFRDIYKYIISADLKANDYESAAKHWSDLKDGMQEHISYYQSVFENEEEMKKFSDRQLEYMRDYTPEFVQRKRQDVLARLKEWHGEEKCKELEKLIKDNM